jgi:BirA family transcriptional regulator, biotin operon repressor / biotin---[acetyl-CoA-carboxylase] ligase
MRRHVSVDRPPLRKAALTRALVLPDGLWSRVEVVTETGSTNADVSRSARLGVAEGLVRMAENQRAGRGRLDRTWQAPPRSGLTMSVLLRPAVPNARLGWLPLLAGVAVAQACDALPGVDAGLKWPNDVLVRVSGDAGRWGKCGGILAETVPPELPTAGLACVVGIGINVFQDVAELPEPRDCLAYPATSLALAGAAVDRESLTVAVLGALADWYQRWVAVAGDPVTSGLREAYRAICLTMGREVQVSLPGGASVVGRVSDIDGDGRLVVATSAGRRALAAGDVHHVR